MPTFLDQPIILLISEIIYARLRVILVAVYLICLRRGDLVHKRPVAHDVMAEADWVASAHETVTRWRTSRRLSARTWGAMWSGGSKSGAGKWLWLTVE